MLSPVGRPAPLVVQRGDAQIQVTLVPAPFPLKFPELPGPPKVGTAAPPLKLSAYRGTVPTELTDGRSHLLFFWATWCAPCKAAIPELLAFEQERGTQVIAITDEGAELLDPFFERFKNPFPATVATDELRQAFQTYAVSGTPTFVLIDGTGRVTSQSTGYTPELSLGVAGWSWSKRDDGTGR
jgi:thiol-disulfide isomerase/thioredoxin